MLESLVSIRPSQAKNSNSIKLDSHSAELIERFHKESLNYSHMLSFSRTMIFGVTTPTHKNMKIVLFVCWCSRHFTSCAKSNTFF